MSFRLNGPTCTIPNLQLQAFDTKPAKQIWVGLLLCNTLLDKAFLLENALAVVSH